MLLQSLRYSEYNIAGGTPNHTYGSIITIQHYAARILLALLTFEVTGYRPELAVRHQRFKINGYDMDCQ